MSQKTILNIKDLSVTFITKRIVDGVSLSVGRGQIVALVGANGCGKSTILRVIRAYAENTLDELDREQTAVGGSISLSRNLTTAHLPQNPRQLWRPEADITPEQRKSLAALAESFGIETENRNPAGLSDGQLQKAAIIDTLTREADLYLLDEPTNYLDLSGISALEERLEVMKSRGAAVLLVTHDRELTDNLADRTVCITPNGIYHCVGGFSNAWSLTTGDFESRAKQAASIRRRIKRLQEDVQRRASWAAGKEKSKKGARASKPTIAKQAKKMAARSKAVAGRVDREVEELNRKKPFIPKKLNLSFPPYDVRQIDAFSLREVSFSYDRHASVRLLESITLSGSTKDKQCLMGTNGAGKSTLFRLISGQLQPQTGECYRHPSANIAYLPQGLQGYFDRPTLLENFLGCGSETEIRQHLGAALLRRDKVTEPIANFSQGELMRAAIVRCILQKAEYLLMDEPTSHLDIESIEVLEALLNGFAGGYLIVSHDRRFVQNVAGKLYLLEGGHLSIV
ncbi:MAG: ATP-binding cassette domain-containing protein [bacterium]